MTDFGRLNPLGAQLDPRRIPILRPYPDEVPWELLPKPFADSLDLNRMRVAKLHDEVVGVYAFEQAAALRYSITALAVAAPHRKKGLGSWLLGHAIGVCETKGAQEITVPCPKRPPDSAVAGGKGARPGTAQCGPTTAPAAHRLLSRAGFERLQGEYRLLLTPD